MISQAPSKSLFIDRDTPLDLTTVFRDSAGLRIARFIVREYLKEAEKPRFAGNAIPSFAQDTFCSVSPLRFDSSLEVRRMLEERLVFRESEPVISAQGHLGRSGFSRISGEGFDMSRESNFARAEQNHQQANSFADIQTTSHISYPQRSAYSSSFRTSQIQSGPLSHPQFRPTKSQAELDIDALFEEPTPQNQGTESPYRVESPSGRASGLSSLQRSPQRWNENESLASNLPSLDKDYFQLDRTLLSNSSPLNHSTQTSVPRQSYLSDSGYFSEAQAPPPASQSRRDNDTASHHTGSSTIQSSPSIKSFLPVNKATDNTTSSPAVKSSGFSYSLGSDEAIVSQNSLASDLSTGPNHDNTRPNHTTLHTSQRHNTSCSTQSRPLRQHFPSSSTNHFANHQQFDFEQFPHLSENHGIEMEHSTSDSASKKRKTKTDDAPRAKKIKTDKAYKPKRVPKAREKKPEPAKYRIGQDLWMRILEFTPPSFLKKARVLNKEFKGWVDNFNSIYVNQRKENYGQDMPPAPNGLTDRQYNDLLGGKGCLELGCTDKLASRTHWSWAQRWCWDCWKAKIEREDRVLKLNHTPHGRNLVAKLLECIPVGMHDSFLKPHDFIEDLESRPRGAPRLYRYYLKEDVQNIIDKYDALTPAPFVEDPTQTPEERNRARAAWQEEMDKLDDKKTKFLEDGKKANDKHMETVQKIESLVKKRRDLVAQPYNNNRQARRELFTRRAREDLPHIPTSFVESTKAYKAATRIFRDGGTERGWQTLRPKIEKEFEKSKATSTNSAIADLDEEETPEQEGDGNGTHSTTQPDLGRTTVQTNRAVMQRRYNAEQLRAQRDLMLFGPGLSNAASGLSLSMQAGFSTMQRQAHLNQHQQSFAGGLSRAPSLYDNFGPTLFQRQQQLMNRSGPPSNFDSYSPFQSMTQTMSQPSSTQNNSNGFQPSSSGQLPRISISSLLGDGPSAPPKPNLYNRFE